MKTMKISKLIEVLSPHAQSEVRVGIHSTDERLAEVYTTVAKIEFHFDSDGNLCGVYLEAE
jgi:hypothetical protein